jgi:hypothetical protein
MDLSYPIGKYEAPRSFEAQSRSEFIRVIGDSATQFRRAVQGLDDRQLDTPYRPGGWTVRQVIHHVADSHMNAYIRFRLALTEDEPTIKPYDQDKWAVLEDARVGPLEPSLSLIENMHARLVSLAASLPEESFGRAFFHPERGRMTLDEVLAMYSWHCRHHAAHITSLLARMGWA